jgi:acyl carrier protein
MLNKSKYDSIFIEVFGINQMELTDELGYLSVPSWDSVGHMILVGELEDTFGIMLEMNDIIDLKSYKIGIETMKKYGVEF